MTIREYARAKLNLSLHVTGLRDDGYHLLDCLVAFAEPCDIIEVCKADVTTLEVVGPMAAGIPTDASNLVLQAAALFPVEYATQITLHKNLPAAAGVGGGSADAAATLRAMAALWGCALPSLDQQLSLGADVPVCMTTAPKRMGGIGEDLSAVHGMPQFGVILVNPNKSVPTGRVFSGLLNKDNDPMGGIPSNTTPFEFLAWLGDQRNDLEAPAIAHCADIEAVLKRLSELNPLLTRMSGSGGTCFAVFENNGCAEMAAKEVRKSHPHWWVDDGRLLTA